MARAALAGKAAVRAALTGAIAVTALAIAARVFAVDMARLSFTRKFAIGTGSTRAIAVSALSVTFRVVSLTINMARRSVALELALLPFFTGTVALVTVTVTLAANENANAQQEHEQDPQRAIFHRAELARARRVQPGDRQSNRAIGSGHVLKWADTLALLRRRETRAVKGPTSARELVSPLPRRPVWPRDR